MQANRHFGKRSDEKSFTAARCGGNDINVRREPGKYKTFR